MTGPADNPAPLTSGCSAPRRLITRPPVSFGPDLPLPPASRLFVVFVGAIAIGSTAAAVGAYYITDKLDDGAGTEAKRTIYRFSAMYAFGPNEVHANLGVAGKVKINGASQDNTGAKQFTLGYNYNLSKRTKVYAFYTQVSNDDNAAYAVTNAGTKFSSFAAGVRHNF